MNTLPLAVSSGPKRSVQAAFTLIELLVVISIIAILAGILLPVIGGVMENAKKTSAKTTETGIITAIKQYYSEYGAYPVLPSVPASNPAKDTTVGGGGATGSNAELFAVLRATDNAATSSNTRRLVLFEGKDVKTPSKPKDGFVTTGSTLTGNNNVAVKVGDLVDPWGNSYFICYDSGFTDQVNHPYATTPATNNDDGGGTFNPTSMLRVTVIVWSYGKDGQKGNKGNVTGAAPNITNYGDDVISWQ